MKQKTIDPQTFEVRQDHQHINEYRPPQIIKQSKKAKGKKLFK